MLDLSYKVVKTNGESIRESNLAMLVTFLIRMLIGISPNRFICRGSDGVGKGAMVCALLRRRLPASSNAAIYTTW